MVRAADSGSGRAAPQTPGLGLLAGRVLLDCGLGSTWTNWPPSGPHTRPFQELNLGRDVPLTGSISPVLPDAQGQIGPGDRSEAGAPAGGISCSCARLRPPRGKDRGGALTRTLTKSETLRAGRRPVSLVRRVHVLRYLPAVGRDWAASVTRGRPSHGPEDRKVPEAGAKSVGVKERGPGRVLGGRGGNTEEPGQVWSTKGHTCIPSALGGEGRSLVELSSQGQGLRFCLGTPELPARKQEGTPHSISPRGSPAGLACATFKQ